MTAGRPSALTHEVAKRICDAIAAGNYYKAACTYAGIGYSTFLKWMKWGNKGRRGKFREFRRAVEKAKAECEVAIVAQWRAQTPDNWQAGRDFLARRYPERWGPKDRHEVVGGRGGPVRLQIVEEIVDAV